jgi:hypothetical protein
VTPKTDYIRHTAKLTRQLALDTEMGPPPELTAEYWKALAKALEQVADGIESTAKRKD